MNSLYSFSLKLLTGQRLDVDSTQWTEVVVESQSLFIHSALSKGNTVRDGTMEIRKQNIQMSWLAPEEVSDICMMQVESDLPTNKRIK
jgi:hypothetical protein